jgi:SAM-dependent methyltransferase
MTMHEISGDARLSSRQRLVYLAYNFVRGLRGFRCRDHSRAWRAQWPVLTADSPGRHTIDAFLRDMVPRLTTRREISVLDIGCGSGYLREVLDELGYRGHYVGIDIERNSRYDSTERASFESTLILKPIEEVTLDEKFDLVFSNTVLEHIKDDRLALRRASDACAPDGAQIHIMPTYWSLFLYLWHGYRQYNRCTLNALFGADRPAVYRLGGAGSFFVHFFFITIGELFVFRSPRVRQRRAYRTALRLALQLDRLLPVLPAFYAVVSGGRDGATSFSAR